MLARGSQLSFIDPAMDILKVFPATGRFVARNWPSTQTVLKYPLLIVMGLLIMIAVIVWVLVRSLVRLLEVSFTSPKANRIKRRMTNAKTLEEYEILAEELDQMTHRNIWKDVTQSRLYNYQLVDVRLKQLMDAREKRDLPEVLRVLSQTVHTNFAGLQNETLYSKSFIGTKTLIEDYIEEASEATADLDLSLQASFLNTTNPDAKPATTDVELLTDAETFLQRVAGMWGCTALCLSGGAMNGMHHFGIVKTLLEEDLLPRVLCGASAGAVVAGYICTRTDAELHQNLTPENCSSVFRCFQPYGMLERGKNFLTKGHMFDGDFWLMKLREIFGDLTFEEAFIRTGRVLNVVVSRKRGEGQSPPMLVNFLNAPHVLVASAIRASASFPFLIPAQQLIEKRPSDGSLWFVGGGRPLLYPVPNTQPTPGEVNVGPVPPVPFGYTPPPAVTAKGGLVIEDSEQQKDKRRRELSSAGVSHSRTLSSANGSSASSDNLLVGGGSSQYTPDPDPASCPEFFQDGSIDADVPTAQLTEQWGVHYTIVAQVNIHVYPWLQWRSKGSAGLPVAWRAGSGRWRGGFLLSALQTFVTEQMRALLRVIAVLDLMPRIFSVNWGKLVLQDYVGGTLVMVPRKVFLYHFTKVLEDLTVQETEWFFREGALMLWPKMTAVRHRMKIEKKLESLRHTVASIKLKRAASAVEPTTGASSSFPRHPASNTALPFPPTTATPPVANLTTAAAFLTAPPPDTTGSLTRPFSSSYGSHPIGGDPSIDPPPSQSEPPPPPPPPPSSSAPPPTQLSSPTPALGSCPGPETLQQVEGTYFPQPLPPLLLTTSQLTPPSAPRLSACGPAGGLPGSTRTETKSPSSPPLLPLAAAHRLWCAPKPSTVWLLETPETAAAGG